LLSQSIDVRKEQRNVMATDQGHKASIIKILGASFLLSLVRSIMGVFAFVHGRIRYGWSIFFCGSLSDRFYAIPNCIDLRLAKKVVRAVEVRTITASDSVAMMEVSVLRNVTIASPGNCNLSVS
jgi:hypothetical protein